MIANLLKSDSAAATSKLDTATSGTASPQIKAALSATSSPPPPAPKQQQTVKTNSVAAAVAASSQDDDELYGVTDIVSFITGSNL